MTKQYIGPHALLKSFLRVIDPRDTIVEERLADLAGLAVEDAGTAIAGVKNLSIKDAQLFSLGLIEDS